MEVSSVLNGPHVSAMSGNIKNIIIFLHGYGADGNDLIGLADPLKAIFKDTLFLSPHAPEPCAMSPMGRQWFGLTLRDPEEYWRGAEKAKPSLDQYLDDVIEQTNIPASKISLVGFSQGTMMALHTGLRREKQLASIVGFSGLLPMPKSAKIATNFTSKPPVQLIHGDLDAVVPVSATLAAELSLKAHDVKVSKHICENVEHGISPEGLQVAAEFLSMYL